MGVDFALFDNQGLMIQNPLSYRNSIGQGWNRCQMSREHICSGRRVSFAIKINSVNMIKGMMEKCSPCFPMDISFS